MLFLCKCVTRWFLLDSLQVFPCGIFLLISKMLHSNIIHPHYWFYGTSIHFTAKASVSLILSWSWPWWHSHFKGWISHRHGQESKLFASMILIYAWRCELLIINSMVSLSVIPYPERQQPTYLSSCRLVSMELSWECSRKHLSLA